MKAVNKIMLPMGFEAKAQVEHRLPQHFVFAKQQGDQQPAQATDAVQERVDRLKLHVRKGGFQKHRCRFRLIVKV